MNKNMKNAVFRPNQKEPGIIVNIAILKGGNQPPKNSIAFNPLIMMMFEYSPRKNRANVIAEYSTL